MKLAVASRKNKVTRPAGDPAGLARGKQIELDAVNDRRVRQAEKPQPAIRLTFGGIKAAPSADRFQVAVLVAPGRDAQAAPALVLGERERTGLPGRSIDQAKLLVAGPQGPRDRNRIVNCGLRHEVSSPPGRDAP